MNRIRKIAAVTVALTACAGPSAGGQAGPTADDPRGRLHLYEVSNEQVQRAQEAGFIEVSGTGSVTVEPDRALVSFAMETRAVTAADAASANADAMDRVLRAVRAGGFEELDLTTFGYSLQPEYSVTNAQRRTREIVAYVAHNNVRATIADVDAIGRLIDTAIGAGANRVASIAFMASDTDAAQSEALAEAVRTARAQAVVIAESLGYRLGPPLEVRGSPQRPVLPPMRVAATTFEAQAAPTPIEAGDQTVTATVTIRFALGPELGG
jgi:uncharacterized protein YggE